MAFCGFDLFDPGLSDEPAHIDLDDCSLDAVLATSVASAGRLGPRSKTSVELRVTGAAAGSGGKSDGKPSDPIGTVRIRTRIKSSHSEGDFSSLPPEPQQGNIEYKLKLVEPTQQRLEHLVTQMKWRLREGQGEAIYEIGVEDDGLMTGLSDEDMTSSLDTLREMARRLGATIEVLRERVVTTEQGTRTVAEVLVRKVPDDQQCIELRVCVLGSADVGKSTLLGVLTQGQLDNGRGRARLNMFRHLHEIRTGRTSSVSHELLGFDSKGRHVDYTRCNTAEEICETSTKLITFIDLAGHHKYLRTTISGLTGHSPHYVMLVVSASAGVVPMAEEHLGMAVALEVPFFLMVTKVDVTPRQKLQATIASLQSLLKSAGSSKVPLIVRSGDDSITAASNTLKENVVPIFCVSSVSGQGLDMVRKFLHLLPPGAGLKEQEKLEQEHPEFQVDEVFDVPGVGTVVGGLVTQGLITEGMTLNAGPFEDGSFLPVTVTSIKRNRAACRLVRATQSAALAVAFQSGNDGVPSEVSLRRGQYLIDPRAPFLAPANQGSVADAEPASEKKPVSRGACQYFQAKVCVLFHPREIYCGFHTTVHIGSVCQSAVIEGILPGVDGGTGSGASSGAGKGGIKSNDQASIVFRFMQRPEYVKVGQRLLFRDGHSKGTGRVTQIFPYEPKERANR